MTVADTDVLIDALRGRKESAERIAAEIRAGSLATTAITHFELLSGARTGPELEKVTKLLRPMAILPLDQAAAQAAAQARRSLESIGAKIGMADYLIAGICLSRSAPLLTRNRAHFERVPGLTLGRI